MHKNWKTPWDQLLQRQYEDTKPLTWRRISEEGGLELTQSLEHRQLNDLQVAKLSVGLRRLQQPSALCSPSTGVLHSAAREVLLKGDAHSPVPKHGDQGTSQEGIILNSWEFLLTYSFFSLCPSCWLSCQTCPTLRAWCWRSAFPPAICCHRTTGKQCWLSRKLPGKLGCFASHIHLSLPPQRGASCWKLMRLVTEIRGSLY